MTIDDLLTDEAVLAEMGKRLSQRRLELQLTQAELAQRAGVSKRTVERIEAGATSQMSTLIRVFRVLKLLDRLEGLLPQTGPRPLDLLKLKGKERQRAGRRKQQPTSDPWQWGVEE